MGRNFDDEREDFIRRSSSERSVIGRVYGTERHPAAISSKRQRGARGLSSRQMMILVIAVLVVAVILGIVIAAGVEE